MTSSDWTRSGRPSTKKDKEAIPPSRGHYTMQEKMRKQCPDLKIISPDFDQWPMVRHPNTPRSPSTGWNHSRHWPFSWIKGTGFIHLEHHRLAPRHRQTERKWSSKDRSAHRNPTYRRFWPGMEGEKQKTSPRRIALVRISIPFLNYGMPPLPPS